MNQLRALAILISLIMILACSTTPQHQATQADTIAAESPCGSWLKASSEQGPPFTLRGLDGKPYASTFFKDRPVILSFWASWCPNCKLKLLELDHFFTQMGPGKIVVVGVGVHDSKDALKRFAEENKLSFPLLFDSNGDVARAYGVNALPHTSLLDPDGRVMSICSTKSSRYERKFNGETSDLIKMLKDYMG